MDVTESPQLDLGTNPACFAGQVSRKAGDNLSTVIFVRWIRGRLKQRRTMMGEDDHPTFRLFLPDQFDLCIQPILITRMCLVGVVDFPTFDTGEVCDKHFDRICLLL